MKLFFDTMSFLHYMSLEQLNFKDFVVSDSYDVVFPLVTLRELDKHKNTNNSSKIRKKADSTCKKLEEWFEKKEIKPNVNAEFINLTPTKDNTDFDWDPSWSDDVLIATIILYKRENPEVEVLLVTQDITLTTRAKIMGIDIFHLSDKYKLQEELDPYEKEYRELKQRIDKIQNALPKLVLSFEDNIENNKGFKEFTIKLPISISDEEIDRQVDDIKRSYPKEHPPKKTTLNSLGSAQSFIDVIPEAKYDEYNSKLDDYYKDYKEHLLYMLKKYNFFQRSFILNLYIHNVGSSIAKDVDVILYFPSNIVEVYQQDNLPKEQKEPEPPEKPKSTREEFMRTGAKFDFSHLMDDGLKTYRLLYDSFKISLENDYNILKINKDKIKHSTSIKLPQLLISFKFHDNVQNFSCKYKMIPENLTEPVEGELNFVIKIDEDT